MSGYNQDILKEYVPALVYTMYDGYYIYSPFINTLTDDEEGSYTFENGEKVSGLKPYIHYSCRYVTSGVDVVISYTLDNYITIEGIVSNEPVNISGNLTSISSTSSGTSYRGINIGTEILRENAPVYDNNGPTGEIRTYNYKKINGAKYYQESDSSWFTIINNEKYSQGNFELTDSSAQKYYKQSADLRAFIETSPLRNLQNTDSSGYDASIDPGSYNIFEFGAEGNIDSVGIEEPNSNFNQHRLAIIRNSIQTNLASAIANYNNYGTVTANFQMPVLEETEWEEIINNVSIISFLQGLNIGGKLYNGYSIITNTKNGELVSEDSIYMATNDTYYRATERDLNNRNNYVGVLNIDFERKYMETSNGTIYYFPKVQMGSYSSIITQNNINSTDNIYDYMQNIGGNLARAYFTALARERYSMYKTTNGTDQLIASERP